MLFELLKTVLTKEALKLRLQLMLISAINAINDELFQTFGSRECAGDPDEADTTPYTTEADRREMVERALALQDTELDVDVTVDDGSAW